MWAAGHRRDHAGDVFWLEVDWHSHTDQFEAAWNTSRNKEIGTSSDALIFDVARYTTGLAFSQKVCKFRAPATSGPDHCQIVAFWRCQLHFGSLPCNFSPLAGTRQHHKTET
jgi:hypothetical protein